jgi:hypothetical protein
MPTTQQLHHQFLIEQTQELLAIMQEQLHAKYEHAKNIEYFFEEGRNYIKLLKHDTALENPSSSVVGFIVKKSPKAIDNKTNEKFKIGDMLMAAGYNAPATNFARGNILEGYNKASVRWTGI